MIAAYFDAEESESDRYRVEAFKQDEVEHNTEDKDGYLTLHLSKSV